jgi:RNA polymerase sigma factor (sigma-70 family)
VSAAARKRAVVETYARHEAALRRTARRYSICADDAEDALQRGLEILLTKAPTTDQRELIRWTQTVVKHEALAVRQERERILAGPAAAPAGSGVEDWLALIPAPADGPAERLERQEAVARSREALQELKPQELRALGLLAEGYSYAEIGEITGYSRTKINRCLAEGRERFRSLIARSEDGRRCAEMGPLLSAFCDGEAGAEDAVRVREHLRACAHCRATLRSYRAAPAAAAALAPALPAGRSLLERAQEAVTGLASRFGVSAGGESALSQVAASGGTRGAGMAVLAKALAVCAGTIGGAAACVATGVVPAPLGLGTDPATRHQLERAGEPAAAASAEAPVVDYEAAPPANDPEPQPKPSPDHQAAHPAPPAATAPPISGGAVEYVPAPEPEPAAAPSGSASAGGDSGSGNAAGEFGP